MEQLSGVDNFMLYDEQGNIYNHVSALGIYDPTTSATGQTRYKDILQHFKCRISDFPIFSRRLVTVPYGLDRPYWVEDREIDVEFHIRHIALPQPGDWRQLMIQVARLHSRPLDRSRPLWEIYVIEGLDKIQGFPKGSFALFIKFHHASVDGQAAATVIRAVHAITANEEYSSPAPGERVRDSESPSTFKILGNAAKNTAARTLGLSSLYLKTSGRIGSIVWNKLPKPFSRTEKQPALELPGKLAPSTRFNQPISANRVVEAVALPFAQIKQIRELVPGSTINDIFLTVCAGALRDYLSAKGELPDQSLTGMMPISLAERVLTKSRKPSGNNVGGGIVALCTDISDPLQRLRAVHKATGNTKRAAEAMGLTLLHDLMNNLPGSAGRMLLRRGLLRLVNVAVSNVRGPDVPLYVAGARLVHFYPVSIATDYVGLNMTGFSYNDTLWICAVSCRNMMPDPEFFAQCLNNNFQELLKAVSEHQRHVAKMNGAAQTSVAAKPAAKKARKAVAKPASKTKPLAANNSLATAAAGAKKPLKQVSKAPSKTAAAAAATKPASVKKPVVKKPVVKKLSASAGDVVAKPSARKATASSAIAPVAERAKPQSAAVSTAPIEAVSQGSEQ